MSDIIIKMKDVAQRIFKDNGASGGSYCNQKRFELGFVVIIDPYGKETCIPSENIEEIIHEEIPRW